MFDKLFSLHSSIVSGHSEVIFKITFCVMHLVNDSLLLETLTCCSNKNNVMSYFMCFQKERQSVGTTFFWKVLNEQRFNILKCLHFVDNTLYDLPGTVGEKKGWGEDSKIQILKSLRFTLKTVYTPERETIHCVSSLVQINDPLKGVKEAMVSWWLAHLFAILTVTCLNDLQGMAFSLKPTWTPR